MKHLLSLAIVMMVGCGPASPPAQQPTAPEAPAATAELIGAWQGCDGRVVAFNRGDTGITGTYQALGGLGQYGFSVGEEAYRVRAVGDGTYEGEVKWRFTDGREEWRPVSIQITGDQYEDEGSDDCGKSMTRVTAQ